MPRAAAAQHQHFKTTGTVTVADGVLTAPDAPVQHQQDYDHSPGEDFAQPQGPFDHVAARV